MTRCYVCDDQPATYEAHLTHDCTPVVALCTDDAARERDWGSVEWIRSIRTPELAEL